MHSDDLDEIYDQERAIRDWEAYLLDDHLDEVDDEWLYEDGWNANKGGRGVASVRDSLPAASDSEFVDRALAILAACVATLPEGQRRNEQVAVCSKIADAMANFSSAIVQAHPAVGKTLAFLAPAALLASYAGRKVVLACDTHMQQDHLNHMVLPIVSDAVSGVTGHSFTHGVLKGQANYLCYERLRLETLKRESLGHDSTSPYYLEQYESEKYGDWRLQYNTIEAWARRSTTGDFAELEGRISKQITEKLSGRYCMHRVHDADKATPLCHYLRALRKSRSVDVLITNHHQYVKDLQTAGKILPSHDYVIVEEADHFDEAIDAVAGAADGFLNRTLPESRKLILSSTTLHQGAKQEFGVSEGWAAPIKAESHFPAESARLYVPSNLNPEDSEYIEMSRSETEALINAIKGRTLLLFTNSEAMEDTYEHLLMRRRELGVQVFCQDHLPKMKLLELLRRSYNNTVVCATMSFWRSVDVPGDGLQLVILDRMPYAPESPNRWSSYNPDHYAFRLVIQALNRLRRVPSDRGLAAVLDSRLNAAVNARYRKALPPMVPVNSQEEAVNYLRELRSA